MEKVYGGSDQESLPQEILRDILLRLPAKSLWRFRSVSKLWLSIISDPQFISDFFNRSAADPKLLLTVPKVYDSGKFIFSLDYSECRTGKMSQDHRPLSLSVISHGLIRRRSPSDTQVSHSSAGLVCIEFDRVLVVCNPSTREAITLKRLPSCGAWDPRYINHFGFDPVENKYKILSTLDLGREKFRVHVITLGEEKWRRIHGGYPTSDLVTDFSTQVQLNGAGVCINGVIYYLSWLRSTKSYHLIAFDVRLETFKVIPLPDEATGHNNSTFLMESDGCVALVNMVDDYHIRQGIDYLEGGDNYHIRQGIDYLEGGDDHHIQLLDDDELSDCPDEEILVHTLKDVPNQIWIAESFPVPRDLRKLIQTVVLVGTSQKGELLYATSIKSGKSILYVCNLKDGSLRPIEVDGLPKDQSYPSEICKDQLRVCSHVENLVSLKNFSSTCRRY